MVRKYLSLFALALLAAAHVFAQPCNQTLNATYSPAIVCSDRPLNLNASAIAGATYSWTGPAGFTSTQQNPTFPPAFPGGSGVYTVTAVIGGCTYTASVNVAVYFMPPTPSVSQNGPVCPEQPITVFGSTVGGSGVVYHWTGPDGFNPTTTNGFVIIPTMLQQKVGVYKVYAVTGDGCVTNDSGMFVNMWPGIDADFDTKIIEKCTPSDEVVFTDISPGSTSSKWSFGDFQAGTGNSVSHNYPNQPPYPNGKTTFTVTLIAGNGHCFDTIQKGIDIGHPLKAQFTTDKDSICQHSDVNFTDLSYVSPATAPTNLWIFGDGAEDNTLLSAKHTYDRTGIYQMKLIVKDYLGCTDTAERTIVVDSIGFAHFTQSVDAICNGQRVSVSGGYLLYGLDKATWDMGDGNKIFNKEQITHGYDKPGEYTIKLIADYRICPTITAERKLRVKPLPIIDLGPDRTICPGNAPVVINDLVNTGNPNASWKWNTEVINTTAQQTVYYPGEYACTVEIDGCAATDEVTVAKDCYINIPNSFTPGGNGNDYFLPRDLLSRGLTKFSMAIYNRWGQKLFHTNNTQGRGWDGKFNDVPQPMGVYIYLVEAEFLNGTKEKYQGNITLIR